MTSSRVEADLDQDLRTVYIDGIASGPFSRHGRSVSPSPFDSVKVLCCHSPNNFFVDQVFQGA